MANIDLIDLSLKCQTGQVDKTTKSMIKVNTFWKSFLILPLMVLSLLLFTREVYAADYYVNSSIGNDSNDGTAATDQGGGVGPWKTITRSLQEFRLIEGVDHTVYVESGDYFEEGSVAGLGVGANGTLTIVGVNGTPEVKTIEGSSIRPRFDGTVIYKNLYFNGVDFSVLYDGPFIVFEDCEFSGNGEISGGTSYTLEFKRCYFHDFSDAPVRYFGTESVSFESCFLKNSSQIEPMESNKNSPGSLSIKNNTFYNASLYQYSGSFDTVTIENNIFYGTVGVGTFFAKANAGSVMNFSNNIFYRTSIDTPRLYTSYDFLDVTGPVSTDDYYNENTIYYFDPQFDFSNPDIPVLSSTSLAIGRGKDAGVEHDIEGNSFDNTSLPTIGAWAPSVGEKQFILPTEKKIMISGDSITYGKNASSIDLSYPARIENDPDFSDYSFVKMPGDTERHIGVNAIHALKAHFLVQDFVTSETPSIVTLAIGVNDVLHTSKSASTIANQINATIDILKDLGVPNIIYLGTNLETYSGDAPTIQNDIETLVGAHCETVENCRYANLAHKMQKINAGWQSIISDTVHPTDHGHAFMAEVLKPQILADTVINGDNGSISYDQIIGGGDYKYGLLVSGDNVTANNVTISGFEKDGIIVQGDNFDLKNSIVTDSTGEGINVSLTGASLAATEEYNIVNDTTNGLNINGTGSSQQDPLLGSGVYTLTSISPAVDKATDIDGVTQNCSGDCVDYSSNLIYGLPDIGANEYQPSFIMGSDQPDVSADVLIYGDGRFRDTQTASGTTANLDISPTSDDITQYLDISITTWETSGDYQKEWTESSTNITGDVNHIVGELEVGTFSELKVDGVLGANITGSDCDEGICTSNSEGEISFVYTGDYSSHTFSLSEYQEPSTPSPDEGGDDDVDHDSETHTKSSSPKCDDQRPVGIPDLF